MTPTSAGVRARRRLQAVELKRSSGGVAAHLSRLALPIDVEVAPATHLPAATLLASAAAFALVGAAGVAALAVIALGSLAALGRTAPRRRAVATERALPVVLESVARHLRAGGSLAQAISAADPPRTAPDLRRSWERLANLIPVLGVTAALDDWSGGFAPGASSVDPWSTASATSGSFSRSLPSAVAACPPLPSFNIRRLAARRAVPRTSRSTPSATTTPSSRSIQLAAAALSLAASTGGSPARAIDGVAATLRSRLAVADEIRALSSQARASAAVIALAPLAVGALASASDARHRAFLTSPAGATLLLAGLTLDALGAWWMARLCRPPTP